MAAAEKALNIQRLGADCWRVQWSEIEAVFWMNIDARGRLVAGLFKRKDPNHHQDVLTLDVKKPTNAKRVEVRTRQALRQLREEGLIQ